MCLLFFGAVAFLPCCAHRFCCVVLRFLLRVARATSAVLCALLLLRASAPFSDVLWSYGTSRKGSGKEQGEEIAHKFKKKFSWIHAENRYYGSVDARKLLLK